MSPTTCVKPWPGPWRSCVGANIVPRNSMKPSGYWWLAPMAWPTRSSGSRLIFDSELLPCITKPSGPVTCMARSQRRTSSMPNSSSNRRMNGPIAQLALLSLALPSSSALRPSKSRRFTSLPSAAPRTSPRLLTASTISGSGLFQALPGMDADFGAGAHRAHRLRLGEDLGVGADAHLQVLRPHALRDQHFLQAQPPRASPGCTAPRLSPMTADHRLRARLRPARRRRAPAPRSRARASTRRRSRRRP